jgi:hypothetical protein
MAEACSFIAEHRTRQVPPPCCPASVWTMIALHVTRTHPQHDFFYVKADGSPFREDDSGGWHAALGRAFNARRHAGVNDLRKYVTVRARPCLLQMGAGLITDACTPFLTSGRRSREWIGRATLHTHEICNVAWLVEWGPVSPWQTRSTVGSMAPAPHTCSLPSIGPRASPQPHPPHPLQPQSRIATTHPPTHHRWHRFSDQSSAVERFAVAATESMALYEVMDAFSANTTTAACVFYYCIALPSVVQYNADAVGAGRATETRAPVQRCRRGGRGRNLHTRLQ